MAKIAFFGGSFNPPNKAHKKIAKNVLEQLKMDDIVFVPVGNYYKKQGLIDVKYRFNMLNIMCKNESNMHVSDITLKETKCLKAIDVFKKIKLLYKNDDIFFVMGADNFIKIETWKDWQNLVCEYKLIIVERNNINIKNTIMKNEVLLKKYNNMKIININNDSKYLNSTQIRIKIHNSENVDDFIEQDIINYIEKNGLYK